MNSAIAILLLQDGLTSGLIYALLAMSILLVFLVTRVLWVPAGEMIVFGAMTLALLGAGKIPGTAWLLLLIGGAAALSDAWSRWHSADWQGWWRGLGLQLGYPAALLAVLHALPMQSLSFSVQVLVTLAVVGPMAPLLYQAVFKPMASATVLAKLIAAVALHMVLMGAGLLRLGAEGTRVGPFIPGRLDVGFTRVSYQLLLVLSISLTLMVALWSFFGFTLWGKALRATAINRVGSLLNGIPADATGLVAFGIAGFIGALSGILVAPVTTMYYDSGFLFALKGFIGVVCGAMLSFPVAVLGALGVGLLDSFAAFYSSAMRDVIVFSALIPILLWRSLTSGHHEEDEE